MTHFCFSLPLNSEFRCENLTKTFDACIGFNNNIGYQRKIDNDHDCISNLCCLIRSASDELVIVMRFGVNAELWMCVPSAADQAEINEICRHCWCRTGEIEVKILLHL